MKYAATVVLAIGFTIPMSAQQPTGSAAGHGDGHAAPTTQATRAGLNEADMTYAHKMMAHHQMGIEMMHMAEQRGTKPIKTMAGRMRADQTKEVAQLTSWAGKGTHGTTGTSGQMGPKPMSASGVEFDRMFLDMMSKHHQQAIEMSTQASPTLKDARLKNFARQTITKQTKERSEMQRLLTATR